MFTAFLAFLGRPSPSDGRSPPAAPAGSGDGLGLLLVTEPEKVFPVRLDQAARAVADEVFPAGPDQGLNAEAAVLRLVVLEKSPLKLLFPGVGGDKDCLLYTSDHSVGSVYLLPEIHHEQLCQLPHQGVRGNI